jgi:threonyl-tRNA synthetase
MAVNISLPDGLVLHFDGETTVEEIAERAGAARTAVAAKVGDRILDFGTRIADDAEVSLIHDHSKEGLEILRHSAAHVMASAVQKVFADAPLGFGPAIENGFYYDFDLPDLSEDDLERITEAMKTIIEEDLPFEREELPKDEAIRLLKEMGQEYKVEFLEDLPEETVSLYRHDDFVDLCRGPHLPSTGRIRAFKLLNVAGAYWRGLETNPMLKRIYGTAFLSEKELRRYIRAREEAQKRDHRKLGRELDLFSFHREGPGFAFWHPKGLTILDQIIQYWREEHRNDGYVELNTPLILNEELWHRSGHWDNYKDNMYFTRIEGEMYAVKPMNCPGHLLVYKARPHSYREFPLKYAEMGLVHRHEKSGVLHGLFRVRRFTQDDAHIFCTPEQVEEEIIGVIKLLSKIYGTLGFEDYEVELSTKPHKYIGSDEIWDRSTRALENALRELAVDYAVNPGEGAFYGPKIDFHITDCMQRRWQCGTVQLDFSMPERFDLEYIGPDGQKHTPVMIHRAILGSLERFFGILVEHYGGAFPTWLAPVQVRILPITDAHIDYARKVATRLREAGVRVECDERNEKTGYKVRQAALEKIPYMLIVGNREVESDAVSVRERKKGDLGSSPLEAFTQKILEEITEKR